MGDDHVFCKHFANSKLEALQLQLGVFMPTELRTGQGALCHSLQ